MSKFDCHNDLGFLPTEEIRKLQTALFNAHLKHLRNHSPYYREALARFPDREYSLEELQDFSMQYLSGFRAEKRDIERNDLQTEVDQRKLRYTENLLSSVSTETTTALDIRYVLALFQRSIPVTRMATLMSAQIIPGIPMTCCSGWVNMRLMYIT